MSHDQPGIAVNASPQEHPCRIAERNPAFADQQFAIDDRVVMPRCAVWRDDDESNLIVELLDDGGVLPLFGSNAL
jgi:hypothetical protein